MTAVVVDGTEPTVWDSVTDEALGEERPARDVRQREQARSRAVAATLAVLLVVLFAFSISVGDLGVPIRRVIPAIFNYGSHTDTLAVFEWRVPRSLCAVFVGAGLGCSGAVFQSLARNPLASPDIIGISSGATAVAVSLIVLTNVTSSTTIAFGALLGGLVAATVIYLLAYRRGLSSYRLVLIGIGISAMLTAVTNYVITRANQFDAMKATVWMTGSLNNRGWQQLAPVAVSTAVLLPALLALAPKLRMLQLGDDAASGLGVDVERSRALLILIAVGFASIAAATAGPITFVAFVAAPIARRLTRTPLTIVPAALIGAVVLLGSDVVARRLFAPIELPVGVITGVVGAPYLLYLLARSNSIGRGG